MSCFRFMCSFAIYFATSVSIVEDIACTSRRPVRAAEPADQDDDDGSEQPSHTII